MPNENVTSDEQQRVLSDGRAIPDARFRRLAGAGRPGVRERGALGARAAATATSTPPRRTATRRALARPCARAACHATRSSSRPSSIPRARDPAAEAEQSLRRLGVDHLDLYIIHWPQEGPTWAWPGMEAARERGYARSIGVSNFSVDELEQVMAVASAPPVINQVQFSPFEYRRALLEAMRGAGCRRRGLQPARDRAPPVRSDRHRDRATGSAGRPPRSCCVGASSATRSCCPKSTHRERIEENAPVFDFDALRRGHGDARRPRPDRRDRPARANESGGDRGRVVSAGAAPCTGIGVVARPIQVELDSGRFARRPLG